MKIFFHEFKELTQGQAHTVKIILQNLSIETSQLMIFNIDTFYDGGTDRINFYDQGLNFLDVFNAKGDHWSFAKENPKK